MPFRLMAESPESEGLPMKLETTDTLRDWAISAAIFLAAVIFFTFVCTVIADVWGYFEGVVQ